MKKTKRREPNPDELRAAARIRAAFQEKKRKTGITQDIAAGIMGWTRSQFSMYVGGKLPLTIEQVLKLAKLIGQPATELAPEICAPYTNDINRLSANAVIDEQCQVIEDLERRLQEAGVDAKPYARGSQMALINEVLEMLKRLPEAETRIVHGSLIQRLEMLAGLETQGKAAIASPSPGGDDLSFLPTGKEERP